MNVHVQPSPERAADILHIWSLNYVSAEAAGPERMAGT